MSSTEEGSSNESCEKPNNVVITLIYRAIDEVNQTLPIDGKVKKELETKLFVSQSEGSLDSLGLLNFIVATEQEIENEYGFIVDLAGKDMNTQGENPFSSIETFAKYIEKNFIKKS